MVLVHRHYKGCKNCSREWYSIMLGDYWLMLQQGGSWSAISNSYTSVVSLEYQVPPISPPGNYTRYHLYHHNSTVSLDAPTSLGNFSDLSAHLPGWASGPAAEVLQHPHGPEAVRRVIQQLRNHPQFTSNSRWFLPNIWFTINLTAGLWIKLFMDQTDLTVVVLEIEGFTSSVHCRR